MQLSKRLQALADMVTEGNCLTDVGTDHGYVPIYLIEQKKIPSAIAMDINKGPLERAREHIRTFGYEAYIETRLSDGLAALKGGEADTVLIAGMGGGLTLRILEAGVQVLSSVQELILQPQSELYQVRRYLKEHGYQIIEEHMVFEDEKYYPMMKVRTSPSDMTRHTKDDERKTDKDRNDIYTETEYYFGKVSLQRNPEILLSYLKKSLAVQEQILDNLKHSSSEKAIVRQQAVHEYISHLNICKEEVENNAVTRDY